MKTSIKKLTDTKVEITIILGAEELAVAQEVATAKLAKNVKVAGFRKGKTPASVAAKNIDPVALQEQTIEDAMSKSVAEAFMASDYQALERPAVAIKKFVPGEVLEFTAEAEILPEVKLGDYKKLKVAVEKVTVDDKEVQETLDRIRTSFSDKKDVKRAAKDGDEVVIDFVGKRDGIEFDGGKGEDYPLTLGAGQFIPGFEEGIVGHKPGEVFDLNLTFPKDYHASDLRGAKVVFTTTLKTVKGVVLPELDDKFAAKVGPFTAIKDLKDDIKKELLANKEAEAKNRQKDELIKKLIEISQVPVPDVLVNDQIESIKQDFSRNLSYQGMTLDQYLQTKGFKSEDDWVQKEVRVAAIDRVKAGLALAELSKKEKIEASVEELDQQVEAYKKQYANNPEAVAQFDQPEVKRDVASRLITEKTINRLVELNSK